MRLETRARISFEGAGILTPELPEDSPAVMVSAESAMQKRRQVRKDESIGSVLIRFAILYSDMVYFVIL